MSYENWGIIGHEIIVEFLKKSLENSKLAQSYLFHGIQGVGKTTVAEKFAEAILKPAGSLESCAEFYPLKIQPSKKEIGIDQVREWRRVLGLKTFANGYKVGIIYEAECLNAESANALLKTLEEPSPKTVLIMVSSGSSRLLPLTIVSRAQSLKFLPVKKDDLLKQLKAKFTKAPAQTIFEAVELSGGRPGLALRFLNEPKTEDEYADKNEFLRQALSSVNDKKIRMVEKFFSEAENSGSKLKQGIDLLNHLEAFLRKSMFESVEKANDGHEMLKNFCLLDEAREQLNHNVQPRLVLENLFLNLKMS